MTHSHSELIQPKVKPRWTICSLDKNASRLALLYEILPSFQKKGIIVFDQMMYRSQASRSPLAALFMEWFWYVSKQTPFLKSIFLLVASVKSYAKSPNAFALVFLQTVCISA